MSRSLAFILACCACGAAHASSLADKCLGRAPIIVNGLVAHDYTTANQQLGPTMRLMFSPETLKDNWDAMNHEYGAYVSHGQPMVFKDDAKNAFIRVTMSFAHGDATMQIVCSKDSDGQIDSLAFL